MNFWKRRLAHQDDGVTLIEMMVALAIFSIAILGLLGTFSVTAAGIQKQQYRAKAERVALDENEHLRLADYDSAELALGTHTGSATAVDGSHFSYSYTVIERAAGTGQNGDVVKEIRTTVSWTGAHAGDITFVTAVARPAADIGLPAGYAQTIRSMAITPAPSTVVDYNGYTATDIMVTVILTGHTTSDVVHISWQDDRGNSTPSVDATSSNGYQWVANIGHGGSGIHLKVPGGIDPATGKAAYKNLTFTAKTDTGLTTTATLPVYGPTLNPPTISDCHVNTATGNNDIKVSKGGNNQYLNTADVLVTCTVAGLSSSSDTVKVSYPGPTGASIEVQLKPTATPVQSSGSTWTYTFVKTTTYFNIGDTTVKNPPPLTSTWNFAVARSSDGGPAAATANVTVHT